MAEPTDCLDYVRGALALQGYDFSEERIAEIAAQFARIESIARTILPDGSIHGELPADGPAAVFRP